jgi:uncharacterized protein
MLRDDLKTAQISAMKAGDKERLSAVRLILAKLKDRDIEQRTSSKSMEDDALVIEVLQKMVKQRRESIEMYEKGGREELAAIERGDRGAGLGLVHLLGQKLLDHGQLAALKAELGAEGLKDMGRLMAELKARHGTVLDMGRASGWVKESLS